MRRLRVSRLRALQMDCAPGVYSIAGHNGTLDRARHITVALSGGVFQVSGYAAQISKQRYLATLTRGQFGLTGNQVTFTRPGTAPVITTAPVLIGIPTVGVPVAYTPGTVTGSPTPTRTQQWFLDGSSIAGATASTYTPVSNDTGHSLSVRQTETNTVGSANRTSTALIVAQTDGWDAVIPTQTGTVGAAFSLDLDTLWNGTQPTYAVTTGSLPTGLSLSGARNNIVSGTPTTAQTVTPTFTASVSSGADADFQARISAPGVFRSFGFNSSADLGGVFGDNVGTVPGTGTMGLDANVKASGTSSLRFDLLAGGSGNSCSWFTNFHSNLQRYGANTSFFFQFKVRIGQTAFEDYTHKFFLCGSGDDGTQVFSSCTDLELEMQHYSNNSGSTINAANAFPIMYNACPGSCGGTWPFYESLAGGNFDLQPNSVAPICSYNDSSRIGCVHFVPEQWMVFQVGVDVGPRVTSGGHYWFQGSRVRLWMQTSPGAAEQLIIDWLTNSISGSQIGLCAGNGATGNQAYGKLWLLPYTQNSIGAGARAGNVWFDEVILSEQKIPAAQA